jgi:hypothetical protein
MLFIRPKTIIVGTTLGMLFLGTGCLQNIANSNFSSSNNLSAKQIQSESDGVIALKEVFDSSVEKIPTLSAVGYAVVSSQPGRTGCSKKTYGYKIS